MNNFHLSLLCGLITTTAALCIIKSILSLLLCSLNRLSSDESSEKARTVSLFQAEGEMICMFRAGQSTQTEFSFFMPYKLICFGLVADRGTLAREF